MANIKKTSVQEAIDEIKSKALAENHKSYTYWAYIECINILEYKLEKEKEDLIEAHYEGQKECSNEFAMESDAKLYYNQTFKQ